MLSVKKICINFVDFYVFFVKNVKKRENMAFLSTFILRDMAQFAGGKTAAFSHYFR